jgi:thymidine phosphorylase
MWKKFAVGTASLVIDLMLGSGALLKDYDRARELA